MSYTFSGGIHVDEHKLTAGAVTEKLPPPETVVIPMAQHIGAEATPTVKAGDLVKRGQVIGSIEKGLGAPVHSSVSGKVTRVSEKIMPNAKKIRTVIIENDGKNTLADDIKPWPKPLTETTAEEIIEVIRSAGISGMGGATFPTHAKIASALGKVEHVIINCAECEPYITADHRLLLERPEAVIGGLKILLKAFGLRKGMIAVEDNKLDAVNKLEELAVETDLVEVKVLKTKYPQGDERQIIYALLGKELPAGKLPADVGCCVFNAETTAAIYDAFTTGMPLVERIVTVSGDCVKTPKNVLVPIGASFMSLLEFCGGLTRSPSKIVSGGPMMGTARWDINSPVTKGTSALLFLSREAERPYEQPPVCIRCGRCVKGCPMHLMPSYLAGFARRGRLEEAEQLDIMSCVECGSCSYSCPGHLPIVQYIRVAKSQITDRKHAEAAALAQSKKD